MTSEYFWAGLNAILSGAIVFVCVCRLNKTNKKVLLRVKLSYLVLLVGVAANGMAPWKFEIPGWPSVLFAASVLYHLVSDAFQWKTGPPTSATQEVTHG